MAWSKKKQIAYMKEYHKKHPAKFKKSKAYNKKRYDSLFKSEHISAFAHKIVDKRVV